MKKKFLRDRETCYNKRREVKLSEDGSVEFETLTDDEEITIPSQDRAREISDLRNVNIRDEQTLENTQREDWLLPTEPMHGARPRQPVRERPLVIDNPALRDAAENAADGDAAEISAVRHPSRTTVCRQDGGFLWKKRYSHCRGGGGGVRPLSLRVYHERYELYLNFLRRTVYEMVVKARRRSGRRWIC